ncbi:uroporphyrinogen-III synthase [Flavobacterium subsaxonicum]|uniref:Uroporphyrinogen-III synthase n=1 Tax=Flavobacterium subsaxonicum WB 4.1-42 = DSM 21790 TaxID=1121898 RepID=A0A0A2MIP1_9FLAO|nr:uroporphyrinogen-III synthase [Flavobacterium subsaxonicum]KGO91471.1 uroporphyrinogen-III synthase [Flavobacterium subsaxonicum WB 4.1-42 = DSM 21790]
MKVKTILVSQPEPKVENSPYFEIQHKLKVKVDFRPFIHVEGVNAKDVRAQKVDLNNYSAIILTSKNSIDHFFRVAEEMRFKVPETMKYFCQSEAIAFYLQKYVVYRKRKIYVGQKDFVDLSPLIKKYKDEKFLLPASDQLNDDIPTTLNNLKVDWTPGTFYRTVMSDLTDLKDVYYDVLAFFSPTGIKSLFKNFPDFKQNDTRIAVFGSTTQKEALEHGLRIDIMAPAPGTPSMTMALEKYITEANKGK